MHIGVFKPNMRKFNSLYLWNYCIDCNQIFQSDKDHQVPFMCGPNMLQINPRWRMATILKNHYISTTDWQILTKFGTLMHLGTPSANKIWKFLKSKMVAAAILKQEKSQYPKNCWTNFKKICHSDAARPSRLNLPIKIENFKNPRWCWPPSWKIKIANLQ